MVAKLVLGRFVISFSSQKKTNAYSTMSLSNDMTMWCKFSCTYVRLTLPGSLFCFVSVTGQIFYLGDSGWPDRFFICVAAVGLYYLTSFS